MGLSAGQRLGPYEIVAPLGAGGMGEVYRARDPRLDREVAVKVIPEELASQKDRLRRFEQEARATAALSHPNILAVFDVGAEGEVHYIVTELLAGETLRERLRRERLPVREAVDSGIQIARGLAAAHERGIAHRDLKPENLFVLPGGRVKILDFGLAKVVRAEPAQDLASKVPTFTRDTDAGTVVGTVGYMSPEQVRGLAADHRADIFALGAVLYEMLSGERAFRGETSADTLIAILQQDPPELSLARPELPPALERIVQHCLEKSPLERFQSAHDVAFALESLTVLSRVSAAGSARTQTPRARWPRAVALAAAALAALAGVFVAGRMTADRPVAVVRALTFRSGNVVTARFALDGRTVVYGAAWDGGPVELYSGRLDSAESKALGLPAAGILAVSSSGEMAISMGCQFMEGWGGCRGTLAVVPFTGGAPRELLENVVGADWSPDGKELAVAREIRGQWRIEYPLGRTLCESPEAKRLPRVSPHGDLVAFIEQQPGTGAGGAPSAALTVVDRKGTRRVLATGLLWGTGLAWTQDGGEIWFSGNYGLQPGIHAVTLRGRDRLVDTGHGRLADIGPQGQVLMIRQNSRMGIVGLAPGETRERNLSWFDYSVPADLSADGRTLLFGERLAGAAGAQFGVYLRRTDGSPAVRLGDGTAVALSPDGKWVLARTAPSQLTLLPTGAGSSRVLASTFEEVGDGSWMPDNRAVLLVAREHGHDWRTYLEDLEGGQPRAITPEDVAGNIVSPDGQLVAAARDNEAGALYPLAGGSPRPVPGLGPDDEPVRWSHDGRALFIVRHEGWKAALFRLDILTGRRELLRDLQPADPAGLLGFAEHVLVDDAARSYVYSYRRALSMLLLAEGLR